MSDVPNKRILPMKDTFDSYRETFSDMFDLPMRTLIVGKSDLTGKTTYIGNLILRDTYYRKLFKGANIYIVCTSMDFDEKWQTIVEMKKIPEENIMRKFDEDKLRSIYNKLKNEYIEAVSNGEKPVHSLIIFDDCTSGELKSKKGGVLDDIAQIGRHALISFILTVQKYTSISTLCREQCNGAVLFFCTPKQRDLIGEDHNYLEDKKDFATMLRKHTSAKHHHLIVKYGGETEKNVTYFNRDWEPIDVVIHT